MNSLFLVVFFFFKLHHVFACVGVCFTRFSLQLKHSIVKEDVYIKLMFPCNIFFFSAGLVSDFVFLLFTSHPFMTREATLKKLEN